MAEKLRVDKWLWYARFFKTRSLAATQVSSGHVRLNGQKLGKSSVTVSAGDVLTFSQGRHVRVIKVIDLATRRGPAPEAQALYEDLDPPKPRPAEQKPLNPSFDGKGRPSGRERRKLDAYRTHHLE